jgi:recombinational DNA repair protein (RecF pathway)
MTNDHLFLGTEGEIIEFPEFGNCYKCCKTIPIGHKTITTEGLICATCSSGARIHMIERDASIDFAHKLLEEKALLVERLREVEKSLEVFEEVSAAWLPIVSA